jgi:type II secretory pathway pseudopilin PulG
MFGQIKMVITIVLIAGIAGAGMYVMKLRADNATLKANQIQLETAINEQQEVITQQKESYENILTTNKELSAKLEVLQKDNDELTKKFAKYDIATWGMENPKAAQKVINKAAAAACGGDP